jgi:hypothetical protein
VKVSGGYSHGGQNSRLPRAALSSPQVSAERQVESSALLPRNQAELSLLGLKFLPMDIADFTYQEKHGVEKSFE